eukprot:1188225-Prorocentrum_minimum.AAC.1
MPLRLTPGTLSKLTLHATHVGLASRYQECESAPYICNKQGGSLSREQPGNSEELPLPPLFVFSLSTRYGSYGRQRDVMDKEQLVLLRDATAKIRYKKAMA